MTHPIIENVRIAICEAYRIPPSSAQMARAAVAAVLDPENWPGAHPDFVAALKLAKSEILGSGSGEAKGILQSYKSLEDDNKSLRAQVIHHSRLLNEYEQDRGKTIAALETILADTNARAWASLAEPRASDRESAALAKADGK